MAPAPHQRALPSGLLPKGSSLERLNALMCATGARRSYAPLDFPFVGSRLGRSGARQARRMTGIGGEHTVAVKLGRDFFLCFVIYRRFRLCGGDQRALRSPFGNLRCTPNKQYGLPTFMTGLVYSEAMRRSPEGFAVALWTPLHRLRIVLSFFDAEGFAPAGVIM